jgi:hypothetical protein
VDIVEVMSRFRVGAASCAMVGAHRGHQGWSTLATTITTQHKPSACPRTGITQGITLRILSARKSVGVEWECASWWHP